MAERSSSTIVRPGQLTDKPPRGDIRCSRDTSIKGERPIARADVATTLLDVAERGEPVASAINIVAK
jgi:NAD(P)H-binding